MTDLTPNDLSHLCDEEFNALSPLGEHAPGPEPLSPAAQDVLDAVHEIVSDTSAADVLAIAAALRAAAEQHHEIEVPFSVVDEWEEIKGSCASFYAAAEWGYKRALEDQKTIATELENLQ